MHIQSRVMLHLLRSVPFEIRHIRFGWECNDQLTPRSSLPQEIWTSQNALRNPMQEKLLRSHYQIMSVYLYRFPLVVKLDRLEMIFIGPLGRTV